MPFATIPAARGSVFFMIILNDAIELTLVSKDLAIEILHLSLHYLFNAILNLYNFKKNVSNL